MTSRLIGVTSFQPHLRLSLFHFFSSTLGSSASSCADRWGTSKYHGTRSHPESHSQPFPSSPTRHLVPLCLLSSPLFIHSTHMLPHGSILLISCDLVRTTWIASIASSPMSCTTASHRCRLRPPLRRPMAPPSRTGATSLPPAPFPLPHVFSAVAVACALPPLPRRSEYSLIAGFVSVGLSRAQGRGQPSRATTHASTHSLRLLTSRHRTRLVMRCSRHAHGRGIDERREGGMARSEASGRDASGCDFKSPPLLLCCSSAASAPLSHSATLPLRCQLPAAAALPFQTKSNRTILDARRLSAPATAVTQARRPLPPSL